MTPLSELSPAQKAEYDAEEGRRKQITEAATTSGLPEYIERGKLHSKDMLTRAIQDGRTPKGMQEMGDALHAVEDYYSHSNFIEVALWALHNAGVAAAEPYVKKMTEDMNGTNPALLGGAGPDGKPKIITGTYTPGANNTVSKLELLKAQLRTGEFADAFVIGLIRLDMITQNADF